MLLQVNLEATLDTETDTLYIYLRDKDKDPKPVGTMQISATDMADLDKHGIIVGIEMLNFARMRDPKKNPYVNKRKPNPHQES